MTRGHAHPATAYCALDRLRQPLRDAQNRTSVDGRRWVQRPFPYQGKCLQSLRERYARLSGAALLVAIATICYRTTLGAPSMGTGAAKRNPRQKTAPELRRQVNVRVEPALYHALETIAQQERRSVPQAARQLMEEGLRRHAGGTMPSDDTTADEIAALAAAGEAFDWLADEPELYDDTSGEPL